MMTRIVHPMAFEHDVRHAGCGDEHLGLIILDAFGRVNRMTAAAFAMSREGLFSTEQGFLRFTQPAAMSWLDAQVARLRYTERLSSPLAWESPEHRIELGWWPFRWSEQLDGDPEGLLAIRESKKSTRPSPLAEACRGLGLTNTETEIVLRLANGELVKQIAAARGTSITTVRSQLKIIFQKTGTAKQLHLVQRVLQWSTDSANRAADNTKLFMGSQQRGAVHHRVG
jgi:DNA-binding CsgD family transcriptional regulator